VLELWTSKISGFYPNGIISLVSNLWTNVIMSPTLLCVVFQEHVMYSAYFVMELVWCGLWPLLWLQPQWICTLSINPCNSFDKLWSLLTGHTHAGISLLYSHITLTYAHMYSINPGLWKSFCFCVFNLTHTYATVLLHVTGVEIWFCVIEDHLNQRWLG